MKIRQANAYSMVEVVVAAVLFIVAAAGILGTMVQTRQPAMDSDDQTKAALYSRKVSDWLRSDLSGDTWSSSAWTAGAHAIPADPQFVNMSGTYTVTDVGGGKQVVVDVTY